jgi:hypothetical protein
VTARFVDELGARGFGWIEERAYARTGHALAADGRVWLVDPFEAAGVDERVSALGEPAGIVQLLDRHDRDCAALAKRYSVPHFVVPEQLPDSPFELVPVINRRWWREVALWWPDERVLACADAIGTNPFFRAADDTAGVHPGLRLLPPRRLAAYDPLHLLVGHGEGLHGDDAGAALRQALDTARSGIFRWAISLPRRRGRA